MLLKDEEAIIDMLGQCYNLFVEASRADGVTMPGNRQEFAVLIHNAQNFVLARGMARMQPDRYRV